MQLLYLIAQTISKRYSTKIEFKNTGMLSEIRGYDEVFLEIEAGQSLMMVEWDDAVLTINIPQANVENLRITKLHGYSLFTFKNDATILINFQKSISYFYFFCPIYQATSSVQYVSNFQSSKFDITSDFRDIYVQTLGYYTLDTDLSTSGTWKLLYDGNRETTNIKNVHLTDLFGIVCFHKSSGYISGSITMKNQKGVNPTIPTSVLLEYGSSNNINIISENMMYGGEYQTSSYKAKSIPQFYNEEHILLTNNLGCRSCVLYIRNDNGEYVPIYSNAPYEESHDYHFEREIFMTSDYCDTYTYLDTISSSKIQYNDDGSKKYTIIDKLRVPQNCNKYVRIGVFNIVIIILVVIIVIIIIVFVVVIVLMKKKANKQQANDQTVAEKSLL